LKKHKSRIIDEESNILVEILEAKHGAVIADGWNWKKIKNGDKIEMRKSMHVLQIVRIIGMEESQKEKMKRREKWLSIC
jgi:NAD kinase